MINKQQKKKDDDRRSTYEFSVDEQTFQMIATYFFVSTLIERCT